MEEQHKFTYSPEYLTKRAFSILNSRDKKKKTFIPPEITCKDKKTYVLNFGQFCNSTNRNKESVRKYLEKEVNYQCSLNADETVLKIDTQIKAVEVKNILTNFIKQYVLCPECKSPDTSIEKKNRISYITCKKCKSEHALSNK